MYRGKGQAEEGRGRNQPRATPASQHRLSGRTTKHKKIKLLVVAVTGGVWGVGCGGEWDQGGERKTRLVQACNDSLLVSVYHFSQYQC